ncbi:hypothetical protein [Actomonas aquatica]|uniref:DUF4397 domain-containing protein n=1 Tax=Actomonas aquatica TaxID=2866162 RepID=A0ABZ1CE30_9BACT|nr:hypothetical protein [Opitutus sp. WL0086]WRQ89871.1 hypothetical protein K1X11_010680 [Opitutus sp. WL0086]
MKSSLFTAFLFSATLTVATSFADTAPETPTATVTLTADSTETLAGGGTLTFTATATDYPEDTTVLAWSITLAEGWSFGEVIGDGPSISPSSGTTSPLEWAYIDVPADSAAFTFTVNYPEGISTDSAVTAELILRTGTFPSATTLAVDALAFSPAPSLANPIDFPSIAAKRANDGSFELAATSPSGLPITYTVVSGPALISGNVVTLTGATGRVVIRADQGGDVYYTAADSVTRIFNVVPAAPLIYFGTTSDGTDFAVQIPTGKTTGTLFGRIASTQQFYILTFQVEDDNSVTALDLRLLGNPASAASDLAFNSLRKSLGQDERTPAADLAYTFTGTLTGGVLSLNIAELGVTLTGNVEPADGPTADIAGLYESSSLNSASGTTSSIVGTTGKVFAIAVTPDVIAGGSGTIATSGTFSISTDTAVTINGQVDAPTTTVTGTLILPSGEEDAFAGLSTNTVRTDRMINLSTRAHVDTATGSPLITGFVIGGTTPKRVLLRAVGPTLADFGVTTAMADPQVTVYDATGTEVASVDNWGGDAAVSTATTLTGAFTLPTDSLDAAYLADLAPGPYTMHVTNNGAAGVAIAEIYDASENPNSEYQRLVNISSRGDVTAGEGVLIGGFVVTGNSPKRVLVRGTGPALAELGVTGTLTNPQLKVFNADDQLVAGNDDWETASAVFDGQRTATAAELTTANDTVGAFALAAGSADAALIVTLSPGSYTVELSAATSGQTGNALIEIYEIPE